MRAAILLLFLLVEPGIADAGLFPREFFNWASNEPATRNIQYQLPAHCGPVGTEGYKRPVPTVKMPNVILERGKIVTVTTTSDIINGNTVNVQSLLASPGPDGVSLREALTATNKDHGAFTIRFAPSLTGATIRITGGFLPTLLAGSLIINGDIDGDQKPDITVEGPGLHSKTAFEIASSENTLHAIMIENFRTGVALARPSDDDVSVERTFTNNVISNLHIKNVDTGIDMMSFQYGRGLYGPIATVKERWTNTLFINNTIEPNETGFHVRTQYSSNALFEHTMFLNNTIRLPEGLIDEGAFALGLFSGIGGASQGNKIIDTVIGYNSIEGGSPGMGILVSAGQNGGLSNTIDGILIISNQLHFQARGENPVAGIYVIVGDTGTDWKDPNYRPIVYPEYNVIRSVTIFGNVIDGISQWGIFISLGALGSQHNTITQVSISKNVFSQVGGIHVQAPTAAGIFLSGAMDGARKTLGRPSSWNEMSNVFVQANSVTLPDQLGSMMSLTSGGIKLLGGRAGAANNTLHDISIDHNNVDGGNVIGINVIGGESQGTSGAANNTISALGISCNNVANNPSKLAEKYGGNLKGISLRGGMSGSTGNRMDHVRIVDNLVAGVLNDFSIINNLQDGNLVELDAETTQATTNSPTENSRTLPTTASTENWQSIAYLGVIAIVSVGAVIFLAHRLKKKNQSTTG